jgi:hypothetical protein
MYDENVRIALISFLGRGEVFTMNTHQGSPWGPNITPRPFAEINLPHWLFKSGNATVTTSIS